jgi:hypothetical protein
VGLDCGGATSAIVGQSHGPSTLGTVEQRELTRIPSDPSSCAAMMGYPLAPSFEASDAEVAQMVKRLQSNGWTTDSDFQTHGTARSRRMAWWPSSLHRTPQKRTLELLGECRDMTTTKDTKGSNEIVNLARP